jgi:hypothetical protein
LSPNFSFGEYTKTQEEEEKEEQDAGATRFRKGII